MGNKFRFKMKLLLKSKNRISILCILIVVCVLYIRGIPRSFLIQNNWIIQLIFILIGISVITFLVIRKVVLRKRQRIRQQNENKRILEEVQKATDKLQSRITLASHLIESRKYNKAIEELKDVKLKARLYNLPEITPIAIKMLIRAENEQKQYIIKIFQSQIAEASRLIEFGKYEKAIEELKEIIDEEQPYTISKIFSLAEKSLKDAQMLKTLVKMFKVSNKLKIDDICEQVERSRGETLDVLSNFGEKLGIKIEDDFIIVENSDYLVSMMMDLLQRSFDEWEENEGTKLGKI